MADHLWAPEGENESYTAPPKTRFKDVPSYFLTDVKRYFTSHNKRDIKCIS